MTKSVALEKCNDYVFEDVFVAIKKLFELVPPPDVKDKIVLLKPNILYPKKPETAVCTHPVVVGAAVKAFVDLGAKKVLVGESPAIASSVSSAKATGMYDQVINNGGEWIDFTGTLLVKCPTGKTTKQFEFAQAFEEADIVVSMSKLKTHQFMAYTGAMKNLFGLMVGLKKAQIHYRFSDKNDFGAFLTDLNIAANPQYSIMDAIVGMEGPGGPGSGDPVKLGFLAASDNILALDWTCASLVGYNPIHIANLKDALLRGIWLNSADEIQIVGQKYDDVKVSNFKIVKNPTSSLGKMLPPGLNSLAAKLLAVTPRINSKKCQKCKRCEQICPAHIIKMAGAKGSAKIIERSKCLSCFCCHEICPADAIKLRRLF